MVKPPFEYGEHNAAQRGPQGQVRKQRINSPKEALRQRSAAAFLRDCFARADVALITIRCAPWPGTCGTSGPCEATCSPGESAGGTSLSRNVRVGMKGLGEHCAVHLICVRSEVPGPALGEREALVAVPKAAPQQQQPAVCMKACGKQAVAGLPYP